MPQGHSLPCDEKNSTSAALMIGHRTSVASWDHSQQPWKTPHAPSPQIFLSQLLSRARFLASASSRIWNQNPDARQLHSWSGNCRCPKWGDWAEEFERGHKPKSILRELSRCDVNWIEVYIERLRGYVVMWMRLKSREWGVRVRGHEWDWWVLREERERFRCEVNETKGSEFVCVWEREAVSFVHVCAVGPRGYRSCSGCHCPKAARLQQR